MGTPKAEGRRETSVGSARTGVTRLIPTKGQNATVVFLF